MAIVADCEEKRMSSTGEAKLRKLLILLRDRTAG